MKRDRAGQSLRALREARRRRGESLRCLHDRRLAASFACVRASEAGHGVWAGGRPGLTRSRVGPTPGPTDVRSPPGAAHERHRPTLRACGCDGHRGRPEADRCRARRRSRRLSSNDDVQAGGRVSSELDPCSSARWFDGWRARAPCGDDEAERPVVAARTWLLGRGWQLLGRIDDFEIPRL